MLEIVLVCVTVIGILGIIFINYHNKFQFPIIKINEAENNIETLLHKKLELFGDINPIISEELKEQNILGNIEDIEKKEIDHFELYEQLNSIYSKFLSILDDNEKLIKNQKLSNMTTELEANETDLVATVKFYNDAASVFNKLVSTFPSNIVGFFRRYKKMNIYHHEKKEMFDILNDK